MMWEVDGTVVDGYGASPVSALVAADDRDAAKVLAYEAWTEIYTYPESPVTVYVENAHPTNPVQTRPARIRLETD